MHHRGSITEDAVREIRQAADHGESHAQIAARQISRLLHWCKKNPETGPMNRNPTMRDFMEEVGFIHMMAGLEMHRYEAELQEEESCLAWDDDWDDEDDE